NEDGVAEVLPLVNLAIQKIGQLARLGGELFRGGGEFFEVVGRNGQNSRGRLIAPPSPDVHFRERQRLRVGRILQALQRRIDFGKFGPEDLVLRGFEVLLARRNELVVGALESERVNAPHVQRRVEMVGGERRRFIKIGEQKLDPVDVL